MLAADEISPPLSDDDTAGGLQERKRFQPYHSQSVPKKENLERQAFERAGIISQTTTMMLRNIPNKYTQNSLLQEIDDQGFVGSYDFFYLPMDVHNRSNVGYAFINFCSSADAMRFRRKFSDHRFQRHHSHKISSVCSAHVQGLDENLHHFKNRAVTQAKDSQYRPIVLRGNIRIDFEDALEEAKLRSSAPEAKDITPPSAPSLACRPPPGLGAAGHSPMGKHAAAPGRMDRGSLEQAVRELAIALQLGQMQRAAAPISGLSGPAAPPGLARPPRGVADMPAYVSLPSFIRPRPSEFSSEGSTMDGCSFSRTVTEE